MSSILISLERNKWRVIWILIFRLLWRLKKKVRVFYPEIHFQPICLPQKSRKHHKNLVKPIHDLKKKKKYLKTRNQKSFWAHICFLITFNVKKTISLNSSYHMKSFEIKIDHFCGWNRRQQQLFLYALKFSKSPSLLSPKKNRKKK